MKKIESVNVTWNHPDARYGRPVILDQDQKSITSVDLVNYVKNKFDLTSEELGEKVGKSKRTVEGYCSGTRVPTSVFIVLYTMLKRGDK